MWHDHVGMCAIPPFVCVFLRCLRAICLVCGASCRLNCSGLRDGARAAEGAQAGACGAPLIGIIVPLHCDTKTPVAACRNIARRLGAEKRERKHKSGGGAEKTRGSADEHGEAGKPRAIPVLVTQRKCTRARSTLPSTERATLSKFCRI
jgi:hypothetical protein